MIEIIKGAKPDRARETRQNRAETGYFDLNLIKQTSGR